MAEPRDKKLSPDETLELTERLVEVAGSGLPLADGLWAASCEISRRPVRRSLRQLAEFIRRGGTLNQAVETGQLPLPGHVTGLLKASARTGHLAQVLMELADHYRRTRDVWRQLWLALSYPVTLLGLLAVILGIVIALVVPEMAAIYRDFGTELPTMTRSLIWVSLTGWKYFAVALLILVGLAVLTRLASGARVWTRILSSIPGLGRLIHWEGFSEFARLLRLLLLQDVPLPEALGLTADGVRNANVAHISRELARMTEQGQSLSNSMQALAQVPAQIIPLVRVGEQNGQLPAAMTVIDELLEGQMMLRSRLLKMVLPPLVFLIVAVIACALVFSLLMPMLGLITNLQ